MRQLVKIRGRAFTLYGKSIKVEGMADFVFFGREVTKADARLLASIIELGREEIKAEFKSLFNL